MTNPNLNQNCQTSLKNFNPLWRYEQNGDWIFTKWIISTKWNAHTLYEKFKMQFITYFRHYCRNFHTWIGDGSHFSAFLANFEVYETCCPPLLHIQFLPIIILFCLISGEGKQGICKIYILTLIAVLKTLYCLRSWRSFRIFEI